MNNKNFNQLQSEIDMHLNITSNILKETIDSMSKSKKVKDEKMNTLRKQMKEIESFKF